MKLPAGIRVLCLLSGIVLGARTLDARAQPVDIYAEALERYSSGDFSGAIAILDQLADSEVRAAIAKRWRRLVLADAASIRQLRTAILAHTETWFVNAEAVPAKDYSIHLEAARSLARALFRETEESPSEAAAADRRFVRNWYLSIAAFLHGHMKVGRSRVYVAEAKRMFPRDAELLLVDGAGHEMLSDVTVGTIQLYDSTGNPTSNERVNAEKELRQATEVLGEAVAAEPRLLEARLRFGRVLYQRGDLAGATRELEAARLSTKQPEIKYLATVFLGMLHASRGEFERAAALYREAIAMQPNGQAAFLGLSEVEYLSGRVNEAAAIISKVLTNASKDDPWWTYQLGSWWHLEARFLGLRADVRR